MSEEGETQMKALFEATGAEPGAVAITRMSARAAEIPQRQGGLVASWFNGALAAISVTAFAWALWVAPAQVQAPAGGAADPIELAYGTYLDVGWEDEPLWEDPLDGLHGDLDPEEVLEEYDALFEGLETHRVGGEE